MMIRIQTRREQMREFRKTDRHGPCTVLIPRQWTKVMDTTGQLMVGFLQLLGHSEQDSSSSPSKATANGNAQGQDRTRQINKTVNGHEIDAKGRETSISLVASKTSPWCTIAIRKIRLPYMYCNSLRGMDRW